MFETPFLQLPLRIGQRRNLAPVFFGSCGLTLIAVMMLAFVSNGATPMIAGLALMGVAALLVGILQYRNPPTLILTSSDLSFSWFGRTTRWRWSDVDGFRLARVRSGRAVTFDVARAGKITIAAVPDLFEIDAESLVTTLQKVRDMQVNKRAKGGSSHVTNRG